MWSERLRLFTQTSIWRFTLAFTVVVLLICSGILVMVYQFTVAEQRRQLEQQILTVANGFQDLSNLESVHFVEFTQAIQERTEKSHSLVIALNHQDQIIGNLESFPDAIPAFPQLVRFPIAVINYQGETEPTIVLGTQVMTKFGILLVGLFDDYHKEEKQFLTVSGFALGGALLFTVGIGVIFNRRVLSRVKQISELVAQVQSGQLQTRLPLSKRADEYDLISNQINQMLDDIDGLVNSISNITDNIAHDLRTPLSRIRIRIEEVLRKKGEELGEEPWLVDVQTELDQVLETFNAMLELSRLEKSTLALEKSPCDLVKICQDVVDLVQPLVQQKLQLEWIVEEPGVVQGETHLLFRAIYNVVENAIRYTPEQGQVKIVLKGTCLVVEDNGPGIPEFERENVFQRLYQLDKSRQDQGFGLGLSIVKAILQLHGGRIQLEDNHPGLRVILQLGPID